MVPRVHGETYAERIPNTKLTVIPGAGHSAHVEKPQETADVIREFLEKENEPRRGVWHTP
jgi:pimeloyl-ACP methyl ester carboxylesterase